MFHLAAFRSDLAISASYAQLAAVADAALTRNAANQYIMPANMRVIGAHAQGLTISRAQIQAPSLRMIAFPEIYPTIIGALTAVPDQQGFCDYADYGPRLLQNEAVGVYGSNSSGVATSPTVAALMITERRIPAPQGMATTIVATTTNTTVLDNWSLSTLTFETQLAAGEYAVVGMVAIADNSSYARLVFPGASNIRPGVPVLDTYGEKQWHDNFRNGRYGLFGRFPFNNPPQLELFGSVAAATPATILLDVVKVM